MSLTPSHPEASVSRQIQAIAVVAAYQSLARHSRQLVTLLDTPLSHPACTDLAVAMVRADLAQIDAALNTVEE